MSLTSAVNLSNTLPNTLSNILAIILITGITAAFANDEDRENAGQRKQSNLPYPPPLPEYPCPQIAPGEKVKNHCFEDKKNKYLQTEGPDHRGLNFYNYATEFFHQHGFGTDSAHQASYSFGVQALFDALGFPDYQKSMMVNNDTMQLYAYAFDYKGAKDYLMTVYTVHGYVYSIGYSQTSMKIDHSWRKYEKTSP